MAFYSLEGLLWVLSLKFPEDNVVLVKPRMMREHFAIYVNFMQVDSFGNPRSLADPQSQAEADPPQASRVASWIGKVLKLNLHVRACWPSEVLNALMREAKVELWSRVQAVHFIDTGLNVPGVFPADEEELRKLKDLVPSSFEIWLHCTPRRPFVAKEHNEFEERCKAIGFSVLRRHYAEGLPISLEMHFDSLRCFYTSAGDQDAGNAHCGFFRAWQDIAEAAMES
eukprot:g33605.t1